MAAVVGDPSNAQGSAGERPLPDAVARNGTKCGASATSPVISQAVPLGVVEEMTAPESLRLAGVGCIACIDVPPTRHKSYTADERQRIGEARRRGRRMGGAYLLGVVLFRIS